MTVLLRTADEVDLAAVGALHHASRTAAYAGLISPVALAAGSAAAMGEWWTERWRWERDTHRLSVAEMAGRPGLAGFSYAGPSETAGAVELYAIHVHPELVGTGVGRALMVGALTDLAALAAQPAVPAQPAVTAPPAVATQPAEHAGVTRSGEATAPSEAARDAGIERAVLWVLVGNMRARRFYERGGWAADGARRDSAIGPEFVPQLRYARQLPDP